MSFFLDLRLFWLWNELVCVYGCWTTWGAKRLFLDRTGKVVTRNMNYEVTGSLLDRKLVFTSLNHAYVRSFQQCWRSKNVKLGMTSMVLFGIENLFFHWSIMLIRASFLTILKVTKIPYQNKNLQSHHRWQK